MKTYSQISDLSQPVVGLSDEYPAGYLDRDHSHRHSQLLFAVRGVMQIVTASSSFTVPPQRALLVPAFTAHEVRCRGAVSIRTLYFDWSLDLAERCLLIDVSDFLRALILEIVDRSESRSFSHREAKIWDILKSDLATSPVAPYHVPVPSDERLKRVCRALLKNPADGRSLDNWVSAAAMGRRSFTRLFKEQTGMSFEVWKREIRLLEAISLLNAGLPVTQTAFEVGYENVSAFTARFRRTMGAPPTTFLKQKPTDQGSTAPY
jgi:AraC-like DNA-binding protein